MLKDELVPKDILMEELPPRISVLIVGPPGSGKTIFSQQLVYQILKEHKSAIYIASKSHVSSIVSSKKLFNWDVGSYMDNNQLNVVEFRNVTDPTELNISLVQVIKECREPLSLVVVDSLTALMVGIDQGKVMRFTEGLAERLQDQDVGLLLLATPTTEAEDFLIKLKSLVACVIEIRLEEGGTIQRHVRIFKFLGKKHSTQWFPFEITDNGIQFASSSVKVPDTFLFSLEGTLVAMEMDGEHIREEVDKLVVNRGYPEELLDNTEPALETLLKAVDYLRENNKDWEGLKREGFMYLERKEQEAVPRAICLEGAKNVLEILKEMKKKVGIITGMNKEGALEVLTKCELSPYADILVTRDDVENGEPHLNLVLKALKNLDSIPERTIVLGDHHTKVEAGNMAGCFTVGVLTGSGTKKTLQDADLILNSVKNLEKILTMVEQ
jgi:KaiC/GvpD/RAD55 family RecA-like ATPase/phosphoglycolate phosphatase-like HAD superfamily hydrolase